jgi:hypothetical protein
MRFVPHVLGEGAWKVVRNVQVGGVVLGLLDQRRLCICCLDGNRVDADNFGRNLILLDRNRFLLLRLVVIVFVFAFANFLDVFVGVSGHDDYFFFSLQTLSSLFCVEFVESLPFCLFSCAKWDLFLEELWLVTSEHLFRPVEMFIELVFRRSVVIKVQLV